MTIFGPQELLKEGELRPLDRDRLTQCFSEIGYTNCHQHGGSAAPLDYMFNLGVERRIAGVNPRSRARFEQEVINYPRRKLRDLDSYLKVYHLLEAIQSGPPNVRSAFERALNFGFDRLGTTFLGSELGGMISLFETVGYEIRFNPMKRNEDKKYDLDAVVVEPYQAVLQARRTGRKAGLVVCLGKDMSYEDNLKLASKTNEWARNGYVVGLDLAGPESKMNLESETELAMVKACYETATNGAKVGKTIHIGETDHTSVESMVKVIEAIEPDRIGHGIRAVKAVIEEGDYRAIDAIKAYGIVLEICPYSNLLSGAIGNMDEMRIILEFLYQKEVRFMLGTDGLCAHGFDPETTARRNGHFGVTMADEAVMLWLCGISEEVLRYGLLNGERHSFL